MYQQCLLLGAVINAGVPTEEELFRSDVLARFDFKCPEQELEGYVDPKAAEYLKGTLEKFRTHGIEFVPIGVESDGSCLPHAISKALTGFELFYDTLRADLQKELRNNEAWYRTVLPLGRLLTDDESWSAKWAEIVESASPTRGRLVGSEKYLEGIHILGIANVLRRPVLLLDTPELMAQISASEINNCGLYLPLRHPRESVLEGFNRCLGPIVIGWQSASHSHYVALVQRRLSMKSTIAHLMANPDIDAQWKDVDQSLNSLPDMTHCVIMGFLSGNHPNARFRACSVLIIILRNLLRYIDNPKEYAKFSTIKVENKAMKYRIMNVNYAMDILLQSGFKAETPEGVATLVFPLENAVMGPQIEIIITCLQSFTLADTYKDLTYPGMMEIPESALPELFGACPLVPADLTTDPETPSPITWEVATRIYGDGAEDRGEAWCMGVGQAANEFVRAAMLQAAKSFTALTRGTLGAWPDVITKFTDLSKAAIMRCPECRCEAAWPADPTVGVEQFERISQMPQQFRTKACPGCEAKGVTTQLTVDTTYAMRVKRAILAAFGPGASWKCAMDRCHLANSSDSTQCFGCKTPRPEVKEDETRKAGDATSPVRPAAAPAAAAADSAAADSTAAGDSAGPDLGIMSGLNAAWSALGLSGGAAPEGEKDASPSQPN